MVLLREVIKWVREVRKEEPTVGLVVVVGFFPGVVFWGVGVVGEIMVVRKGFWGELKLFIG